MRPKTLRSVQAAAFAIATAVALFATPRPAIATTVSAVTSWSADALAPGESKSYVWNNANSDIYQATAGGVRADSPTVACSVAVTNQGYRRPAGGARTFLLTIKNVDTVSCQATVFLARMPADTSGATGVINPGSSRSWWWNNANVRDLVYFIGVTPGDPASGSCQLQTDWSQRIKPSGEHEFMWTVRNTGSVACEGTWKLGWLAQNRSTTFPASDPPSPPGSLFWLSSPHSTAFRVYGFGIVLRPAASGDCVWGPTSREVQGNPSIPTSGTRTRVGYSNTGSVACTVDGIRLALIP